MEIVPVTFVYGPESSFKVSIYGTVAEVFVAENFEARAFIYDTVAVQNDVQPDLCSSCSLTRQISSTDLPKYEVSWEKTMAEKIKFRGMKWSAWIIRAESFLIETIL